jgi:Fur family ferric uptake transcriptional regulator
MAEFLAERLRQAGYRLTAPRRAVLQVVEATREHLGYAETLEHGRAIYPALGRATVYRTLELLTDLGILRPLHQGDGSVQFARVEEGHHHVICLNCGTAIHFDECPVEELEQALEKRLRFKIQGHMLEFYGLCRECQERR